jgi:hypothetical protein
MGQIVKSGALGAIPARAGARVLETAATMGGGSALAEALGAQVSGEEGAALESGLMSGSFGAGLGLIGKVAGKFSTAAAENAQTREFLVRLTSPYVEGGIKGIRREVRAEASRLLDAENKELRSTVWEIVLEE